MLEAQVLIKRWRIEYNMARPQSSLGGQTPESVANLPRETALAALKQIPLIELLKAVKKRLVSFTGPVNSNGRNDS